MAAIHQLRATGTAVLLVTHELDEAERLCDKVVAMRAGRVIDAGYRDLIDRHGGAAVISFTLPPAVVPDYWLVAWATSRARARCPCTTAVPRCEATGVP